MALNPRTRARRLVFSLLLTVAGGAAWSGGPAPAYIVAADGSGDFTTIQAALDEIPADNRERIVIEVRDGIYPEIVRINADRVTLRGRSRSGVQIQFDAPAAQFRGTGVVNIRGDDVVLENMTVTNLYQDPSHHAYTLLGNNARTILKDIDTPSTGGDSIRLMNSNYGMFYAANCYFRGAVDAVCPRGWCFIRDSRFYQSAPRLESIWHNGQSNENQKFVLRDCAFDGVPGFHLGRYHVDAQFYLLNCTFSPTMADQKIYYRLYPEGTPQFEANKLKWGERVYYYQCRRLDGPEFPWYADNLDQAKGAPKPAEITPAWAFDGQWDPERADPPAIVKVERDGERIAVTFSEDVSVYGAPCLKLAGGDQAVYAGGSGASRLLFKAAGDAAPKSLDLNGGSIIACLATVAPRLVAAQPLPES